MKAIFFTFSLFLLAGTFNCLAQATAYANIYATVIAPVGIDSASELTTNEIVVSNINNGTTINSIPNITVSGNSLDKDGTAVLATFNIIDNNHSVFDVSLPSENLEVGEGNKRAITLSNFVFSSTMNNGIKDKNNKITIEANLFVAANQINTSQRSQNPFPVTLNYN